MKLPLAISKDKILCWDYRRNLASNAKFGFNGNKERVKMIYDKILVIDDDERVAKGIKVSLPEFEIIHFTDPFAALAFLKRPYKPALVLLDVYMDKVNGLDILLNIKGQFPEIVVIIMTGFGTMGVAVQALRNKADDFIEKPFEINDLKEKLRAHLLRKQQEEGGKDETRDKVAKMKMFVESNCSDVNLKDLSEILNLTPKYVSRMFTQKSAKNFRLYKLEAKVERAKQMLRKSQMSIEEVATSLGYKNSESFMRMFKRMVNLTPSQFRKIANL